MGILLNTLNHYQMTAIEFTHQIAGLRGTLQTFTRRFTHDKDESLDLVQDTILKALHIVINFVRIPT